MPEQSTSSANGLRLPRRRLGLPLKHPALSARCLFGNTLLGSTLLISSPASAVADFQWDVYGKVDLQALYTSHDLYRYADAGWQLEAPFSRLGLKAEQALSDDLRLIAVYEWQVNGLDNANKGQRLGSRNTYAGLASKQFGELTFGKNDSRFKKSEGKIDLFNETLADMAQLLPGQDRLENIVSYQSPKLGLWQWSSTYQTGASDEVAGGYDWTLSYGDAALKQAPFYLAYARAHALNHLNANRLLAQLLLSDNAAGVWSAGLLWQRSEHQSKPQQGNAWLASLQLTNGASAWKLQYVQDHSHSRHPADGYGFTVGVEQQLSPALSLYSLLSMLRLSATQLSAAQLDAAQLSAAQLDQDNAAAFGVRWQF